MSSSSFRLLMGFFTLLAALALQFWLVPFGIHADFAFAALVVFAFVFDAWELGFLVLIAVFIFNWRPGISVDITAFALIPFVVYIVERRLHADLWIGAVIAVILSLLVLYLAIAPGMIVSSFAALFLDIILCLAAGQIMLWGIASRQ